MKSEHSVSAHNQVIGQTYEGSKDLKLDFQKIVEIQKTFSLRRTNPNINRYLKSSILGDDFKITSILAWLI